MHTMLKMLPKTLMILGVLTLTGTAYAAQLGVSTTSDYGSAVTLAAANAVALQGGGVSLSQAVAQVRRQYKGRIVSAVTEVNGKREVHVIKVLTDDGKVKTVHIQGKQRG